MKILHSNRHNSISNSRMLWILISVSVVFGVLFLARPFHYTPYCAVDPTPCTPDSVNPFDRIALQPGSIQADFYSNIVQNTLGALAFCLPIILWALGTKIRIYFELWLISLTSMMNLCCNELVRAAVQRPRPIVYTAPLIEGLNPTHYTSFYSGHTSFVAVISIYCIFLIHRVFRSPPATLFTSMLMILGTVGTGILRVQGGRHFPTDVIVAAFSGALISALTHWSLRNQLKKPAV